MTKGERIRHVRERSGKSLTAFADDIGVSKQTLYKYENDIITNVPSDKIELMADIVGISPGYIMGWEPEYKPADLKELQKLDPQDVARLKAYHKATKNIQNAIDRLLDLEGDD